MFEKSVLLLKKEKHSQLVNLMLGDFCSDPVMKQFLLHLDENLTLGQKFVLVDLDDSHLFVQSDIYKSLKVR